VYIAEVTEIVKETFLYENRRNSEKTVSIASPITNAYIDFSKMTCSVVALITDIVRDGKRVIGYGFNSNGRYVRVVNA